MIFFDAKLAGFWVWGSSLWIGSGFPNGNKGRISMSSAGKGIHSKRMKLNILKNLESISNRLRHVRVHCGDWKSICGGDWQDNCGVCGIFFDPPYSDYANRCKDLYRVDSENCAHEVRQWCIKRGSSKSYRIVLAGYFEEHEELLNHGWRFQRWTAQGGLASQSDKQGRENRFRETLFISPYCVGHKSFDQKGISKWIKK